MHDVLLEQCNDIESKLANQVIGVYAAGCAVAHSFGNFYAITFAEGSVRAR